MTRHVIINAYALAICVIGVLSVRAEDIGSSASIASDDPDGDRIARHAIFEEAGLRDNTLFVAATARSMLPRERFEYLVGWVLPNADHQTFRVTGEFGTTNPPSDGSSLSTSLEGLATGVAVLSPAVELIQLGQELGRFDELQNRISAVAVSSDDIQQDYLKATLLFLINVGRQDFEAATLDFDRVIDAAMKLDSGSVEVRWPALLMLSAVVDGSDEDIRRHVSEFFFSRFENLAEYSPDAKLDVLNDHLRSLFSLNRSLSQSADLSVSVSSQWLPFVYSNSETRGNGRPLARWNYQRGEVQKLAGHEMDYLAFRSPLLGEFEVECDFTSGHGEYTSFMVAGSTVQVIEDGAALRIGNFRKPYSDVPLPVPLTKFRSTARYRAVVRDGLVKHFLNGQKVFEKPLPAQRDPWVAMRSWRRSLGRVSDFRITGSPTIPDEILLTGDPELSGWAPYFEEGFGPDYGNWQATSDGQGGTAILGRKRPEFAGAFVQKLLRYCRPVIEDGTIEYEFYYSDGESAVHPAFDRLTFLLEPAGVKLHWITDRNFERFPRDPGNVSELSPDGATVTGLPLKADAWNHVAIEVQGNAVQLVLNGQLICQRMLDKSSQRTFGFFHFADQTEARVRHVLWRGDWPKSFPSIRQQDLASRSLDFLDESAQKLTAEFHHDFRADSLLDRFDVVGDLTATEHHENGLLTRLIEGSGVKELRPLIQIGGDFDLVVAFDDLDIQMPVPRWSAGIGVRVLLDSSKDDTVGFYRTLERNAGNRRTSFFHSFLAPDGSRRYPGSYAVEESRSGKLRLARRGDTFHALYAADDSDNFRLIGEFTATTDAVAIQGLRLILKSDKQVVVTTTWKEIHLRAEHLSGLTLADEDVKPQLIRLNERRDTLPVQTIDFSSETDSVPAELNVAGAANATFVSRESGLRMTTDGNGRRVSTVLSNRSRHPHGVDVEVTLDIHRLGTNDLMESGCEAALKVFFDTSMQNSRNPVEATFILRQQSGGFRELVSRIVHRNAGGYLVYLPLHTVPVESPDSFRVVVYESQLYFLYSEADSEEYLVAAVSPISEGLTAHGFHLKFVADGENHATDLTLKKLTIHQMASQDSE